MIDLNALKASKLIAKTTGFGLASAALYAGLYHYEENLLELAASGGWYFVTPVGIALVFSFVHGSFTASFWDMLGIKAKK